MNTGKQYRTRQKSAVIDFLKSREGECHRVSEIVGFFEKNNVKIGQTTVYRTLQTLVAQGIVSKFAAEKGDGAFYQLIKTSPACHRHFHLKCTVCGEIIHVDCIFLKDMEDHVRREHDFALDNSKTVLYGLCNTCSGGEKK